MSNSYGADAGHSSDPLDFGTRTREAVLPAVLVIYTLCVIIALVVQRAGSASKEHVYTGVPRSQAEEAEEKVLLQAGSRLRTPVVSPTLLASKVTLAVDSIGALIAVGLACAFFGRTGLAYRAGSLYWGWCLGMGLSWVALSAIYFAALRLRLQGRTNKLMQGLVVPATLYTLFWTSIALRGALSIGVAFPAVLTVNTILVALSGLLVVLELVVPRGVEPTRGDRPKPLFTGASLLSRALFLHTESFVARNLRHFARQEEVPDLQPEDTAAATLLQFRKDAEELTHSRFFAGKRPSLRWQLLYHFRWDLALQMSWAFVDSLTGFLPAVILRKLVVFLERRDRGEVTGVDEGVIWAVLLGAFQVVNEIAGCQALIRGRKISVRGRHIGIGELFSKVLKRGELIQTTAHSDEAAGPTSTGKLQNLLSADVMRATDSMAYLHNIFPGGLLSITFTILFLFQLMGYSSLCGVALLILLIPIQTILARITQNVQRRVLQATDRRLHISQEVIQAIRVVKAFAWEKSFLQRISKERDDELAAYRQRALLNTTQLFVAFFSTTLVTAFTFWVHVKVFHRPLDAGIAFGAMALFNALRAPLDSFAHMISGFISALVSIDRIDAFLVEDETEKWDASEVSVAGAPSIGFVDATVGYEQQHHVELFVNGDAKLHAEAFQLKHLNLDFPVGELSMVIGSVGSGKSTLLLGLLRETLLLSGSSHLPSPIDRWNLASDQKDLIDATAYCAQSAWLMSDSIRANILFGRPFDLERYQKVLEACALLPDVASLHAGDFTEVGERGVGLSGGQKARISLARAIYSTARHLLLDDVLSAVDSHTAAHLLHRCLQGPLMADRTCILVTNAVALCLPAAKYLVALEEGRAVYAGDPKEAPEALVAQSIQIEEEAGDTGEKKAELDDKVDESKINQEVLAQGAVDFAVWRTYIKAVGNAAILASILSLYGAAQISDLAQNLALRSWAAAYSKVAAPSRKMIAIFALDGGDDDTDYYLGLYAGLSALALFFFTARTALVFLRGLAAARKLHHALLTSIIGARTRFFDVVPVGRIMNRLARDVGLIDGELTDMMMFLLLEIFWTVAIIFAIAMAMPSFLFIAALLGVIFFVVAWAYMRTSRELKRMESVTRSPIFGLVGECLNGIATIRAYGDSPRFFGQIFDMLDDNMRPYWVLWVSNRWLSIRTDMLGAGVSLIVGLFVTLRTDIDAALAGFMLTYALTLQARLMWLARLSADAQINMNSVERVKEYLEIEHEPTTGIKPPAAWPSRDGEIRFEGLSVRYAPELPEVLRNVSFTVRPREKIGICGRTGSGKSTLGLSLLRFLEPASGRIVIDGIDTASIALEELRSRLVLIPQDATLFAGTVRLNLDPFSEHEDDALWDVLRRVNLVRDMNASMDSLPSGVKTPTRDVIEKLDTEIAEGGKNLSAGQRQLLAIARALLKLESCNILLLDEASASLDNATDEAIQRTIREEMSEATILCIAHRLATIADFDRVLVMGHGQVLEFDSPAKLLQDDASHFAQLCRRSGEYDTLLALANRRASATGL